MREPPGNLWEAGDAPASAASGTNRSSTIEHSRILLRLKPPARRDGPQTSRDAARSMRKAAPIQRARVRSFIARQGADGTTDAETGAALGMNQQSITPRRSELVDLGLVRDSGARRPTPSGRKATVWVACVPPAGGVGIERGER